MNEEFKRAIQEFLKEKMDEMYPTIIDKQEFMADIEEVFDDSLEEYDQDRQGILDGIKDKLDSMNLSDLENIEKEI